MEYGDVSAYIKITSFLPRSQDEKEKYLKIGTLYKKDMSLLVK